MRITLKSKDEISMMKKAGRLLASCHQELKKLIRPGITTWEIDQFVESYLREHGATPEQKGYCGYPFATCASVNDIICHGFPSKDPLRDGDIVTIDFVVNLNGWLADSAWSYEVGKVTEEAKKLLDITKQALYIGIEQATIGNRIGDISHAIQRYVEGEGCSVVRDFVGHGIGKKMHEAPKVPHYGQPSSGPRLVEGMVITIEPMVNIGSSDCEISLENLWEARTIDGSLSAQYEHTIAITKQGPMILTEHPPE